MSVMVFYRTDSEHARAVETFLHDFERQTRKQLEVIDPDSREGGNLSRTYDIVEYPSIIATMPDGQLRNMWRGVPLPTIGEVSYYV